MFDLDLWKEITDALKKNRMRSIMTAFGVFWGIFMLIIMSGAGRALETWYSRWGESHSHQFCFFLDRENQQTV